jgi:lipopolysaccharide transport system ATP-binding protein
MSENAIVVENLSKSYLLGHRSSTGAHYKYIALRDVIGREARNFALRAADLIRGRQILQGDEIEEFWALKNVSFKVKEGEVIGIIGRNGAGKSTLLKILSRITEPTDGRILLRGRVSSLLEVGTGFHPELTGRENVFLNGAILGMTRMEIRRKFDEIVEFADVEKFLDTPVKRYSSGMYVRLAFAVAAHLEPEILIVDEVLAVGDAEFQRKCLSKLNDVARGGRTVLFVSHNMNAIERLCTRLICLESGHLVGDYDDMRMGIIAYLDGNSRSANTNAWVNSGNEYQNDYIVPQRLEVRSLGASEQSGSVFSNGYSIQVTINGSVLRSDPALNVGIALYDENEQLLLWSFSTDGNEEDWPTMNVGLVSLQTVIPQNFLNEGSYRLELLASLHYRAWLLEPRTKAPSVTFSIQGGLSKSPYWDSKRPGILAPILAWQSHAQKTDPQPRNIDPHALQA